jgi:deoxycytidylate deaminase
VTLTPTEQRDWDLAKCYLAEARAFSRDPTTKVGAVLVDACGLVIGTGTNRFACVECETVERWHGDFL